MFGQPLEMAKVVADSGNHPRSLSIVCKQNKQASFVKREGQSFVLCVVWHSIMPLRSPHGMYSLFVSS